MIGLGGHCMETLIEASTTRPRTTARPCSSPIRSRASACRSQGHKDNHAGLMNPTQMATLREAMGIAEGEEWEPFAGWPTARAPRS